jgi:hypothetical protein
MNDLTAHGYVRSHKALTCPTCREETKVKRGQAESSLKNFALIG